MKNSTLRQSTVSAYTTQGGVMPPVPADEIYRTYRKSGTFDS